jgi:hypothetical protein
VSKWIHLKKATSRVPPYRDVEKIITPIDLHAIENKLKDEKDEEVGLKEGAPVDVTIEADKKDTIKKAE